LVVLVFAAPCIQFNSSAGYYLGSVCQPCCPELGLNDLCNLVSDRAEYRCLNYSIPGFATERYALVCTPLQENGLPLDGGCKFEGSNETVAPVGVCFQNAAECCEANFTATCNQTSTPSFPQVCWYQDYDNPYMPPEPSQCGNGACAMGCGKKEKEHARSPLSPPLGFWPCSVRRAVFFSSCAGRVHLAAHFRRAV